MFISRRALSSSPYTLVPTRRYVQNTQSGYPQPKDRPARMAEWTTQHIEEWLFDACRVLPEVRDSILDHVKEVNEHKPGVALGNMGLQDVRNCCKNSIKQFNQKHAVTDDLADLAKSYWHAASIFNEISLRKEFTEVYVKNANPYPWPYNGMLHPSNTAIIVIDMQKDFMEEGGYMSFCNPAFKPHVEIIEPIKDLLTAFRQWGYHVIHTREGHEPNMMSLPANKYWRSRGPGFVPTTDASKEPVPSPGLGDGFMMEIDDEGGKKKKVLSRVLTRGYLGWEIIEQCQPILGETIIDKPTKGAFGNTEIEIYLNTRNIKNLVITGVTTDVCVSTIMREANDRGFECILMEDCTASVTDKVKAAIIESVHLSNGIFGCTAKAADLLAVLPHGESEAPYRLN